MNRLEKIINTNLKQKRLSNSDMDYYLNSEQTEYSCKKDGNIIYMFTVYKNGEDCAVNKYICDQDEDVLSSLEEMETLKADGCVIEVLE